MILPRFRDGYENAASAARRNEDTRERVQAVASLAAPPGRIALCCCGEKKKQPERPLWAIRSGSDSPKKGGDEDTDSPGAVFLTSPRPQRFPWEQVPPLEHSYRDDTGEQVERNDRDVRKYAAQ